MFGPDRLCAGSSVKTSTFNSSLQRAFTQRNRIKEGAQLKDKRGNITLYAFRGNMTKTKQAFLLDVVRLTLQKYILSGIFAN